MHILIPVQFSCCRVLWKMRLVLAVGASTMSLRTQMQLIYNVCLLVRWCYLLSAVMHGGAPHCRISQSDCWNQREREGDRELEKIKVELITPNEPAQNSNKTNAANRKHCHRGCEDMKNGDILWQKLVLRPNDIKYVTCESSLPSLLTTDLVREIIFQSPVANHRRGCFYSSVVSGPSGRMTIQIRLQNAKRKKKILLVRHDFCVPKSIPE